MGIYFYNPSEQNYLGNLLFKTLKEPTHKRSFVCHEWEELVERLCKSEDPKLKEIGYHELEKLWHNRKGPVHMTKKIGHNYNRDPYPWDGAETLANSASWTCCDMNLPSTFITCPICDKERDVSEQRGTIIRKGNCHRVTETPS